MLIGEAPGEGEDRNRAPIRWQSGAIAGSHAGGDWIGPTEGLHRERRTLAASSQSDPDTSGDAVCLPFIERQIDLADSEYLVCLGGSAARALLGINGGIMRARGSWFPYPRQTGRVSRRSPSSTRLSCYGSQRIRDDLPGRTCERLRACSKLGLGKHANDGATVLHKPHTRLSPTSSSASALSISFRVSSNP